MVLLRTVAVPLLCFWMYSARPASGFTTKGIVRLDVEGRVGDVRSVLAIKIGGAYQIRLLRPSGSEEKRMRWRDPTLVALSWIVREDGAYTILCEPLGSPPPIPCELSLIQANSPASIEIEAELRRGYELLEDWSFEAQEAAEGIFRAALARTTILSGAGTALDAQLALARVLLLRGKPEEAVPLLDESVAMATSSGDGRRRTLALVQLLHCLDTIGHPDRMEEIAKGILADASERTLPLNTADATLGLGNALYLKSEFRKAEASFAIALERYQSFGNLEGVIEARLGLAYALMDQGRDAAAKPHLQQALEVARAIADEKRTAMALRVLGLAHSKLNENSDAIRHLELAQTLFEKARDEASLVPLYNSLGLLHLRTNDLRSSLDYYLKASVSARRTGFALGEVEALLGAGRALRLLQEYDEAVRAYEGARAIAAEMGHRQMQGAALAGLGNVFADRQDFTRAIECLQLAVSINVNVGNTRKAAEFLNDLVESYISSGRLQDATESSQEALNYAREPVELLQQVRALANLGVVHHRQGDLEQARLYLELALDVDEAMRLRVPGADLRALAFQGAEKRYGDYIALLMQIARENNEPNAPRLALEAVERSRSRVLLDSVRGTFGSALGTDDTDPVSKRLRELHEEVRELALQADLEGDEVARGQTISERLAELRRLRGLQQGGTSADVINQPSALPVDEIEAYFATGETLLLEFFLGEDRSYLWALGRGRFEIYELAPEKDIEQRIRQAFGLLTARQQTTEGSFRERVRRSQENDAAFYREAVSLSRELLGPVTAIDQFTRLVIVSDGALNYFPLGVLAHPQRSGPDPESYVPLLSTHEIVRAPSVTSMLALRARGKGRSPQASVAILADPVFTAEDPRITTQTRSRAPRADAQSATDLNLRGSGRTRASLSRLLGSREELAAIASIAPETATKAMDFLADRATAERVLGESHRVVHFATHGVANDRYPELSGIVLSLVNEQGLPQDGFLRVQDIAALRVDAELVVLSACETAVGHLVRGEGITGLVTALLRAGASGVVASKWKVDDIATQQLMEEFYRGLFRDGLDSAAALRAAQVALWKRKRTQAPFYWGAFELHGIS